MTDDLATLLAAEEHRQGTPYLADPDHCARCAEVDEAWAQAVCEHPETVTLATFDGSPLRFVCAVCGCDFVDVLRSIDQRAAGVRA